MKRRTWIAWVLFASLPTTQLFAAAAPVEISPLRTFKLGKGFTPGRPVVTTAVGIAPGGEIVATAGDDHRVRLWNVKSGQVDFKLEKHIDWVRTLSFHPDGKLLASAGDDRQILLWNVQTGELVRKLPPHDGNIYSVAFSPDGAWLAAVGFERKVRVYETASYVQKYEVDGGSPDLRCATFSPDSAMLATAGRNGQVHVWEAESGRMKLDIAAGIDRICTVAYSPDGAKFITAGEGRLVSAWNATNGENLFTCNVRTHRLFSLAFCGPDLMASGGSDNLIRVWDLDSREERYRLLGHTGSIAAMAYDEQSGLLVSGSFDTTARLWKLQESDSENSSPRRLKDELTGVSLKNPRGR